MSPDLSGPLRRIWPHMAEESRRTAIKAGRAGPDPCPCRKPRTVSISRGTSATQSACGSMPQIVPSAMRHIANGAGGDENLGGRVWFFFEFAYLCPNNKTGNSATGPTGRTQEKNRVPKGKERRCAHPAMPPKDGGETDPARCSGRSGTPTNTGDYANDTIFRVDHQ